MPRAALIYNPNAGRSRRAAFVDEIAAILGRDGLEVGLHPTQSAAEATALAREAAQTGSVERVFTLGGDGSLRAAAQGLFGSPIAVAPLPAGTTNVVARALGIPLRSRRAARVLARAESRPCDVGLCTDGSGDEHVFLMQASAGLDAAIMAAVPSRAKSRGGRLAVGLYGLGAWWRYDYPSIRFRVDDNPPASATHVVAANIAQYGGDFRIAPQAGFFTRRLDLVTFDGRGRFAALAFAARLIAGRHLSMRCACHRPLVDLSLDAPLEAPFQLDGDPLDLPPPLTIRLAEPGLELLFPSPGAPDESARPTRTKRPLAMRADR